MSSATTPRVLVACEFSGTVREAFIDRGYDAWSCDLLPDERGSNRHIRGDVREVLTDGWDLLIVAHPPCTRLCLSGISWLSRPAKGRTLDEMWAELDAAADLFSFLWNAPIRHVAIENPVMHRHGRARIRGYRPPAQTIAPWQFGDAVQKKVCLWLRGLPILRHTNVVKLPEPTFYLRKTGPRAGERYNCYFHQGKSARERSRFFPGIASAMAEQWGPLLGSAERRAA